jgi:hypothetical protein
MLNNGLIIPIPARPERKAKIPSPTTTTPADLKKIVAYLDLENETEPKDKIASTGSVPSAKADIIRKPDINEPLDKADICID